MSEILQVVRIMATTTARGGGDSPPRHRPPPSLSQRASKTSRSLGRSSRALGHDRHGRWAVPRAAPPHGLSLAPDRRRSSGNNTRARIADRPSPCATRADWPTYRDGKRGSAHLSRQKWPMERDETRASRPCILKTYNPSATPRVPSAAPHPLLLATHHADIDTRPVDFQARTNGGLRHASPAPPLP